MESISKTDPYTPVGVLEGTVEITTPFGIHARPAAQLCAIAQKAGHRIWIEANGERVDATGILDILSLGCSKGTRVRVVIETPSDTGVLKEMLSFMNKELREHSENA
jgi:phosphocarrier protein HPr